MHIEIPNTEALPDGFLPQRLPVKRTLYEAEIPLVYITNTLQEQELIAYVADESDQGTFTVLAPISASRLRSLELGTISVLDALTESCAWLHLSGPGRSTAWPLNFNDFPTEFLPRRGTPLLPEHEPILRTRAVGETISLGQIPASVVALVADSSRKALKTLFDFYLAAKSEGRPPEEHRVLYDLPVLSFAFASFELSFGQPRGDLFPSPDFKEIAGNFQKALDWASSDASSDFELGSSEEKEAVLQATLQLTPPVNSAISSIEVSGRWIADRKVVLTRKSRKRVRQSLREADSERIVTYQGRIAEIDTDSLTFVLRDIPDDQDKRGTFDEGLADEMLSLVSYSERVMIAGIERQGRLRVAAVVPLKEGQVSDDQERPA